MVVEKQRILPGRQQSLTHRNTAKLVPSSGVAQSNPISETEATQNPKQTETSRNKEMFSPVPTTCNGAQLPYWNVEQPFLSSWDWETQVPPGDHPNSLALLRLATRSKTSVASSFKLSKGSGSGIVRAEFRPSFGHGA